jgi:hypothetical protein
MKETLLPFKAEMVRAILGRHKGQTRRVVKLNAELKLMRGDLSKAFVDAGRAFSAGEYLHVPCVNDSAGNPWDETVQRLYCPYGEPGDTVLLVREAYLEYGYWDLERPPGEGKEWVRDDSRVHYIADYLGKEIPLPTDPCPIDISHKHWRKKPSIFMPKRLCRIRMPLKDVRVERLQDISEEDAKAEGVEPYVFGHGFTTRENYNTCEYWTGHGFRNGFMVLWDEINGHRPGCSWEDNPWVWILEWDPGKVEVRG